MPKVQHAAAGMRNIQWERQAERKHDAFRAAAPDHVDVAMLGFEEFVSRRPEEGKETDVETVRCIPVRTPGGSEFLLYYTFDHQKVYVYDMIEVPSEDDW